MFVAWVARPVLALLAVVGPWSAAAATFTKIGTGACRTSSGGSGDFRTLSAFRDECEDICADDATCVAFEVRPPGVGGQCKIHRAPITRTARRAVADCFVRQAEENRRDVIGLNASKICREAISNLASEFARATGGPIPRESLNDALGAPTIEISADGLSITTDTGVEMAVLRINANGRPGSGEIFDQSIMRLALTNGLNALLKDVLAEQQRIFLGNIKDDGEAVKIDAYIAEVTDGEIQNATDTQIKIENVPDLDAGVAVILEDIIAGCIGDDTAVFNVQTNVDVVNVDRSVFKFVLVGVMMVSTLLICLTYTVGSCIEFHVKARKNKEFRKLRKAADNPRILFNKENGKVLVESVHVDRKSKQFDNILERLSSLTEKHRFGSKILFEYNKSLREAKQVADTCAPTVRSYFLRQDGEQQLTLTFEKMDKFLTELDNRQRPTGTKDEINNMINDFKEELLVLHASFGPGMNAIVDVFRNSKSPLYDKLKLLTKRATQVKQSIAETTPQKLEPLEPTEVVEGLYVRDKQWSPLAMFLSLNARLKDKFGISTHRLFLGTLGIFLAVGPFRFMGLAGKILVGSVVALALLLELAHGCEDLYLFGLCSSLKRNIFRVFVLLVLAILFAEFITLSTNPDFKPASLLPETNFDLRDYGNANYSRFGPIELPPDHNNLPRDPIDTRRTFLGVPPQYKLEEVLHQKYYVSVIFGIMHGNLLVLCLLPLPICYAFQTLLVRISPLMRHFLPMNPVWLHRTLGHVLLFGLSFTGFLWFVFQGHACFTQEVSIVEVEGRHMPRACLAFDPGAQAGKEVYMLRFEIVWPLGFFFIPLMIFYEYPRTTKNNMALSSTAAFGYRRLFEVLAVAVVFAGCLISLEPGFGYIPFWFIIAGFMALHFIAVVGCCVRHLVSSSDSRDHGQDKWSGFIQKSWWEMAYWCHAFAFSISIAAALYLRFQVFYGALVPWSIYIFDRLYGVYCSCAYNAQIVVEGEKASYTVVGDDGIPSYLRLVLRKPRCFKYNAGQWCHLGFGNAGTYCGLPGNFLPFLEWHAFSIASCNQADNEFLEFHIGVHGGGRAAIDNLSNVWVTKPCFSKDLMLTSSYAEWWCPHRVAVQNSQSAPLEILDKKCQAQEEGIYLVLKPEDGAKQLKLLKPQAQWTGKLWNTVEMLLHQRGDQNKYIRIMGPYGTLPATAFAHPALMLISAGVGFPSSVSMLRKCLEDNLMKEQENQQAVCFMWGASKFDQLLLCFPTLLVDLTWYVHRKSELIRQDRTSPLQDSTRKALEDLKSWLSIKIFIGKVETGDFLVVNPDKKLFPNAEDMTPALREVRSWLLNANVKRNDSGNFADELGHGTYIAQGSIGGSFGDVLRCSTFTREKVMKRSNSLGVCFCGPLDLSRWIQFEVENTIFPKTVEFASEATA